MKYCPNCNKKVPDVSKFCPDCGGNVVEKNNTTDEKILIKSEQYNIKKFRNIMWGICPIIWILFILTAIKDIDDIGIGDFPLIILDFAILGLPFFLIGLIVYAWLSKIELVVTNKRVYGKAAFGKRVDLPLDMIDAVGMSFFKGIAVATPSGKIKFLMIKNKDDIHETISTLLLKRQDMRHNNTVKNEVNASNAEELKKYKELLDSGVITEEEFNAKKKQLLEL